MAERLNDQDVTGRIRTTDCDAVAREVQRLHADLFQVEPDDRILAPFDDVRRFFEGRWPDLHGCDTAYHNLQHTLDVTLAMARLMDGHDRSEPGARRVGERLFRFGLVLALFHDIGYLRRRGDTRHRNGAEYTLTHVSRGARFLDDYLGWAGFEDLLPVAGPLVHFTGYEVPVDRIGVTDPLLRRLGQMLGSADILAQMADRCYLEKCRDRLYPEFVAGGVAVQRDGDGTPRVAFASADDLVAKTPGFYRTAQTRLDGALGGAYRYATPHFHGQNLYVDELEKNIRHAAMVAQRQDPELLRRTPPDPMLPTRVDAPGTAPRATALPHA
ncbi:MAG: hypothetical protein MUF30_00100 [Burkholderiales bacterium]|jgi:hypothetical protein|nr:hypothetical protein [Burkholderiales bacterium]